MSIRVPQFSAGISNIRDWGSQLRLKEGQDLPHASCRIVARPSARDLTASMHAHTSSFPTVLHAASCSLSTLEFTELRVPLHLSFFTALAQCSSATTLRLNVVRLYNFHQLRRRFISALRSLKHLDVREVDPPQVSDDAQTATLDPTIFTPISIRLETLELNVSSFVRPANLLAALIDWLVRTSMCESLTAFTLYGPRSIRKELAERTCLLIQAAGSSLRKLKNPFRTYIGL